MKKKWIKDLGANECIHAPTKEISDKICKKFDELGMCWRNGESYLDNTQYNVYKENTQYYPYDGSYSDKEYILDLSSTVYTINDLLDFDGENITVSDEGYTKEEIEFLDRFAGLAMNAMLQAPFQMEKLRGDVSENDKTLSITCYRLSKAMLRARKEALKNG